MSATIERRRINGYMDWLKRQVKSSADHPAQQEFKKLLRGIRRRRNRYMRNGEWPPKKTVKFGSGEMFITTGGIFTKLGDVIDVEFTLKNNTDKDGVSLFKKFAEEKS